MLEHQIVRRVVDGADFLHDDVLLAQHFLRSKAGSDRMSDKTSSASGTSALSTRA